MTKEQLLDSFKNYRVVRKPGYDIRPGDFLVLKSIDSFLYTFAVDSLIVKAVNIQSWHDGSIQVVVDFYDHPEQFSNGAVLNGHNYYDIKIFN